MKTKSSGQMHISKRSQCERATFYMTPTQNILEKARLWRQLKYEKFQRFKGREEEG